MTKLSHKNYAGVLRCYFSKGLFAVCILGIGILLLNGCIKKNSGDGTGGRPTKAQTIQALKDFYQAAGGDNWTVKWDLTKDYTTWQGVEANEYISGDGTEYFSVILTLPENNLSGDIVDILKLLVEKGNVNVFDLSKNNITGNLPRGIRGGRGLFISKINLSHNQLSGSIPTDLLISDNRSNLENLDLSYNELTGNLPTTLIGNVPYNINLSHNQLSGSIPVQYQNWIRLLDLSYNNFTGSIPEVIKNEKGFTFCPQNENFGFTDCLTTP